MKPAFILLIIAAAAIGCDRNRVGDEQGYVEREATDLSTIETGTSDRDAKTAQPGSATGPGGETSGGAYGTGGNAVPGSGQGQGSTNAAHSTP